MATPNVGILTNTGKNLIDQVNAGQTKITFSKIVFSSMNNNQLTDDQIKALTTVAPQEVVVNNPKVTLDNNTGETRIRATGNNEALTDGVYVKTYAVYAKDDSGNEILYGITVSPNPNYLPEYDGVTPQAVTYSYKVNISNTSNITFTNSNDIYVSDTDLAEALQPYAKTVDVNQQLDKKVVDNKNGTEQLNGVQVQPFNKLSDTIGGRNLLLGTSSVKVRNPTWNNFINVDVTNLVGTTLTYSAIIDITDSDRGAISFSLTPQYSSGKPIGNGVFSNSIKWGNVGKAIATITIPAGASNLSINERTNNTGQNPRVGSRKLEKGSIATDWTPAPEDKVNVSDMRKPASDVAGIEEVNAKQDKIGYTPADDSKVAHLSGANNFDTVPTVNNNPLLLASSLPSDLARTGSDQEFTGKNTFDTAPIDKTTGHPYITKDGVPSIPSDVARTGQAQTFTAQQTFSIAPTITDASTDKGDNQAATMADLKSVENSAWHYIITKDMGGNADISLLYQKDVAKKCIYVIFIAELGAGNYSSGYSINLDMSSVVKSFNNESSCYGKQGNNGASYTVTGSGSIINFGTFTGTISKQGFVDFASDLESSVGSLKNRCALGVSEFA